MGTREEKVDGVNGKGEGKSEKHGKKRLCYRLASARFSVESV